MVSTTIGLTKGGHSPELRWPAEWERHRAVWLAWPSHADLWGADIEGAREEFVALCRAIVRAAEGAATRAERLAILVLDDEGRREAATALAGLDAELHVVAFGDIWLRDTGPIFALESGKLAAARFRFNGWGGKYVFAFDDAVALRIAELAGARVREASFVLEGGAVETDGEQTCITTRQCLLDPSRNPGMDAARYAAGLGDALGVRKLLWLGDGLAGDHTDGHVDTLARFARPGLVLCMRAHAADDPNRDALRAVASDLGGCVDARGRRLEVVEIPSPGLISDEQGRPLPASYLNFYISNTSVVVPVFGSSYDSAAVDAIAACFPGRATIGLSARHILSGGGAFHCITQPEPEIAVA